MSKLVQKKDESTESDYLSLDYCSVGTSCYVTLSFFACDSLVAGGVGRGRGRGRGVLQKAPVPSSQAAANAEPLQNGISQINAS